MCRGIPSTLLVLYSAESWWKNARASFYEGGAKGGAIVELLMPMDLTLRTGAGEMKTRNPRVRGNIARTIIESVTTCLGIEMKFQEA